MHKMLMLALATTLMPLASIVADLIPREVLFRQPPCMAVKISPDGQRLAYVGADVSGAMNLYVTPTLTLAGAEQVTHFKEPEIKGFFWSPDGKKLIFLKDSEGTRDFHLYWLNLNSEEMRDLTAAFDRGTAKVFHISAVDNRAIVGLNNRNPRFHDLYLLDFDNGSLTLLQTNDEYINYLFDDHLNIVVKVRLNADGSVSVLDKDSRTVLTAGSEDAFHTECLGYNEKQNALYVLDSRGSNTTQLKKIFLSGKQHDVRIGHNGKSDILNVIFEDEKPTFYSTYFTRKEWHALNDKAKAEIDEIISQIGPNFDIVDRSKDYQWWVVKNIVPERGIEHWLYHRTDKQLTLLSAFPRIDTLARMYPLIIPAEDGKQLVSYLTLPKDMDNEGRPKKPLPLVVIPHGGPFKIRDFYTYSPYHQWLADRGYAVLSVNFRLSSGFGKDFVSAGNKQWGRKAHQDIVDAVRWCIEEKIAEESKIGIFGISYGGYEALAALTFTPDVFACGIAVCGPSDLKTVLDKVPYYWELPLYPLSDKNNLYTKNAFMTSIGGDPNKADDIPFLQNCSPLHFVDQIHKPLLLVHGLNDPIVASSESDQIFEKMQQKDRAVIYMSFPDEGHGIMKAPNTLCYLAYTEWMLSQVLGGTYEPVQEKQLKLSSARIRTSGMSYEIVTEPSYSGISAARR